MVVHVTVALKCISVMKVPCHVALGNCQPVRCYMCLAHICYVFVQALRRVVSAGTASIQSSTQAAGQQVQQVSSALQDSRQVMEDALQEGCGLDVAMAKQVLETASTAAAAINGEHFASLHSQY